MSHSAFCRRVIERCSEYDFQAMLYTEGGVLKACYSRAAKWDKIARSTRVIGIYNKRADPLVMEQDIEEFLRVRDATLKSIREGVAPALNVVVDNLIQNLHKVSGNRLAALKVALRDFNIQKQRWYERGGS